MLGRFPVRSSCFLLIGALIGAAPARAEAAGPKTHVVYAGQRLGSIAKRYNVTIAALCKRNGIRASDVIRPGQRLIIPGPGDEDEDSAEPETPKTKTGRAAKGEAARGPFLVHEVARGQRLELIARRYGVSVAAICQENRISAKSVLHPGQRLSIPGVPAKEPDEEAQGVPAPSRNAASSAPEKSYEPYLKPPRKKGLIELVGKSGRYRGYVIGKKGEILSRAYLEISKLLGASGSRPKLDRRVVSLLVLISDRFGGRPIRVVSGYRERSYFQDSRHKSSQAVDFSLLGVPNRAVSDFLRTQKNLGVGYYPNSSFVHADVREYSAYWVDYAGPGQPPRLARLSTRREPPSAIAAGVRSSPPIEAQGEAPAEGDGPNDAAAGSIQGH
jgi:LysM repeat protein